MTTLHKTLITAALAVAVGAGIYEARLASQFRDKLQSLRQQQEPLTDQVQQLQQVRDDTLRQLAILREENELLNRNTRELLKLRGEVGIIRARNQELENQQSKNSISAPNVEPGSPILASGIETLKSRWREEKAKWLEADQRVKELAEDLRVPDAVATNTSSISNEPGADVSQYKPYFEAVRDRERLGRFVDILIRKLAMEILDSDAADSTNAPTLRPN